MDDRISFVIPEDCPRGRADRILASIPEIGKTRSSIAQLIKSGSIRANGLVIRPSTLLGPGDRIEFQDIERLNAGPVFENPPTISIIYENDDLLVVDKPAGLVTHPGAGTNRATLVDIVIRIRPQIVGIGQEGRWGIVHRLDKDTSGVMVIAKSQPAYLDLSRQFKSHNIHRIYTAIIRGAPKSDAGIIDSPIGRGLRDRKKMTTRPVRGRSAHSNWRVIERFEGFALLEIRPKTGRTHQIRTHLASVNMPVLGDTVYGAPSARQVRHEKLLGKLLEIINRQALHAAELGLSLEGQEMTTLYSSELPGDMKSVTDLLRSIKSD